MHAVARQLDEALSRLDPQAAAALERAVRDAVAITESELKQQQPIGEVAAKIRAALSIPAAADEKDSMGYPKGYFDEVVGSLEGQPFDYPNDPPLEPPAVW